MLALFYEYVPILTVGLIFPTTGLIYVDFLRLNEAKS